jgi:hypothetical protein
MYNIQLGIIPAFVPLLSFPSSLFCLLPAHALHLKPKEISSFDHAGFPTVSRHLHLYTLFSDIRTVLRFFELCVSVSQRISFSSVNFIRQDVSLLCKCRTSSPNAQTSSSRN